VGRRRNNPLHNPRLQGVLVLDKPVDFTSQQAVSRVRAALRLKKAGHGGTLDPFATGVLPVMINSTTRIAPMLGGDDKLYEGVAVLGTTTDTLDPTGEVLQTQPIDGITGEDVARALAPFDGEIEQIPPMYSAVKIGGERLYDLARRNIEVERKAKTVTIHSIELLEVDLPRVRFRVHCSTGTYVRVIVSDLGEALGCGGHLAELVRLRSGRFSLDDAVDMDTIEVAGSRFRDEEADRGETPEGKRWRWPHDDASTWWEERLGDSLRSVAQATDLPTLELPAPMLRRLMNGEPLRAEDLPALGPLDFEADDHLLVGDGPRRVIAVLRANCRSGIAVRMPARSPVLDIVRVLRG
jgi:tRNA pseudouridine55 synthase